MKLRTAAQHEQVAYSERAVPQSAGMAAADHQRDAPERDDEADECQTRRPTSTRLEAGDDHQVAA
jgi:hypothetical protein